MVQIDLVDICGSDHSLCGRKRAARWKPITVDM